MPDLAYPYDTSLVIKPIVIAENIAHSYADGVPRISAWFAATIGTYGQYVSRLYLTFTPNFIQTSVHSINNQAYLLWVGNNPKNKIVGIKCVLLPVGSNNLENSANAFMLKAIFVPNRKFDKAAAKQ